MAWEYNQFNFAATISWVAILGRSFKGEGSSSVGTKLVPTIIQLSWILAIWECKKK